MNNYNYLYESAMQDNFERQILSGFLTEAKVKELIENNQLNEQQLKVVEELFPSLGGLKNVAKGAMSGLKGAYQKGKDLYQQGKQQAESENFKKLQAAKWRELDNTVNNSQLLQKMDTLKKLFPQDKFVNDVTAYFGKALLELQEYLARYYPHMNIQSTGQPFQSELDQQAQQQSIDAQADAANERSNLRSAGITGKPQQNTRRSKVGQPLKVRQRAMTSDSWDRLGNIE
jgi:hypothetical protein